MECRYGPSADKPTVLLVTEIECPLSVMRQVPAECELHQAIFDKAADMLKLEKGRQLVYRGECGRASAIGGEPPQRRRRTDTERKTRLARQRDQCECGAELSDRYETDHVVRLCDGSEDSIDNSEAKCVTCHAENSEIERLGAVYRNPLASQLSIETLGGFFDAPKPLQTVFGDGAEDCVKVDTIRCRSNALIHNLRPLPVASITDEIKPYDPKSAPNHKNFADDADFYYTDAGEPPDDPLEALPYMGPNWYWRENALASMNYGYSKQAGLSNHM